VAEATLGAVRAAVADELKRGLTSLSVGQADVDKRGEQSPPSGEFASRPAAAGVDLKTDRIGGVGADVECDAEVGRDGFAIGASVFASALRPTALRNGLISAARKPRSTTRGGQRDPCVSTAPAATSATCDGSASSSVLRSWQVSKSTGEPVMATSELSSPNGSA